MVLNDGMSAVLKRITSALDTTLNAFEQVQRASGRAVDAAQIAQARSQLVGANAEIQEMADGYRRAAEQEENLNRGLRTGGSLADGMLGKVKTLVATLAAGAGLNKLIGLSDQMTSTTARLSFLVDDGGSVDELEAKIMASAQRSRAAYLDTASAIASMGANAGAAFSSNDELIAFMEQVNRQFTIGGASAQGQAAAMLQLTQAMAAGALRGEELNSILENAPGIARAIEQYMGIAEGSIKQYAQEGQVTAEVVKNALFSVADETNAKFESMPMTWAQIWTNMQNRALQTLDPVLNKLNNLANSEQFSTVVDGALNALATITALASGILDVFVNIGSAVVDNWSVIEPIAWGLVAALVAYNAVALITQAINGAVALSAAVKGAADMFAAGKTFAATVAQQGLNAALLACPITWIVVGVIALVAGIIALCNWIAKTTGVAATGFGVITGGINVAIQAVWNAMLVVANVAIGIWNALGACCSNIGTAFHNVISNVQGWFYGLLSTALTVVEGICAALNKLPFVEFDYSGISAKADEYAAKSAEAYGSVEEYQNIGDAFTKGYNTFDTFTDGWASDAFKAGASWGDGVADKVSSFFDFGGGGTGGTDLGSGFDLSNIADNTGLTADNTGKTADALAVTEEQLEYLRDIAERDAINRFTTAEVKIDMTGMTNRIDGSADLDGVISQLTEGFTEALVTAAAKLTVKIKGKNKTLTLLNEGEINFLRTPGLSEIVLPVTLSMLTGSRSPSYYMGVLERLKTSKGTTQFILVRRSPDGRRLFDTNMTVSVEDYNITEDAKEGLDVSVDINLKQWRSYGTKTAKVEQPSTDTGKQTVTVEKERDASTAPSAKTYTVKKGDTLWAISAKYYGAGAQYTKIYGANTDKISNPNLIYPGQVLTIP